MYLTETPSASLLEFLAVFESKLQDIPAAYPLLRIEAPENAPRRAVEEQDLPRTWKSEIQLTRFLGDAWLEAGEHLFLVVPSVLCHATWNWLLNPEHASAAEVRIVEALRPALDARLLRGR